MTTADMRREAAAIVPPPGATMAIAVVEHTLGEVADGLRLGRGGRTVYRAAFLLDGRRYSPPVGPEFDMPRQAGAFVAILNGGAS